MVCGGEIPEKLMVVIRVTYGGAKCCGLYRGKISQKSKAQFILSNFRHRNPVSRNNLE